MVEANKNTGKFKSLLSVENEEDVGSFGEIAIKNKYQEAKNKI